MALLMSSDIMWGSCGVLGIYISPPRRGDRQKLLRPMKNALAALAAVLSLGYGPVVACPDGEHHQQTRFQAPPTALTPPPRPLVWGELNIIHTTDTHGWLLGHQKSSPPEPNYRFALSVVAANSEC